VLIAQDIITHYNNYIIFKFIWQDKNKRKADKNSAHQEEPRDWSNHFEQSKSFKKAQGKSKIFLPCAS
jgi:hypothetical protein